MRSPSVSRRLLLSVTLPLLLFFGATIVALDSVFRDLSERSTTELLEAQLEALIAAADTDEAGTVVPQLEDAESRLATPGSGLYAQIRTTVSTMWRSPSATAKELDFGPALAPGTRTITRSEVQGEHIQALSRGLRWEDERGRRRDLTFSVATSLAPYEQQLARFRQQLLGWFFGLAVLLLATLAWLTRSALAPIRRLEGEIHEVEGGERELLSTDYPRELAGVSTNLNALLNSERARIARYRDTLGNLAHSLKTPLAVMRNALGSRDPEEIARAVDPEISRMAAIIDHQLKRARATGGITIGRQPVDLAPIVRELRGALLRVHSRKDLTFETEIPPNVRFLGDSGDITEVLGNLLDNACKWAKSRVRIRVAWLEGAAQQGVMPLEVSVEDDGPGIAAGDRARVLKRGERADEQVPGHGLGLAMVTATVDLYGGSLEIAASGLGGALLRLRLPGRRFAPT